MNTFNEEQIIQLAPDAPSLKSGKDLANEKKWLTYACSERVLWGEVQGSGSDPYRTQIDFRNMAFQCSCPSRKFPCKHGLGLFILFARKPALFSQSAQEPDWVKEWMEKRNQKAKQAVVQPMTPANEPIEDKKALKQAKDKEKRNNERMSKVTGGVAELELWLRDLVRSGLLTAPEKGEQFWSKTAARMVDAQSGGLGNMVKEFADIDYYSGNQWHGEVLHQTAKIYLLIEAFKRLDTLPPALQEEVKTLIGWPQTQKELLENPEAETITDHWLLLGRQTEVQEELTIQRNWLYGNRSGRYALVLNFAFKNTPIPILFLPATVTAASLVFYPSAYPLRAVVKQQGPNTELLSPPPALAHWDEAQGHYAAALSTSPWIDYFPLLISQLTPVLHGSRWLLKDQQDSYMEISEKMEEQKIFQLLAYSGGNPLDTFVLRIKNTVFPVGIWQNNFYKVL